MQDKSLDQQLKEFQSKRFIAMPIAGLIVWTVAGLAGWLLTPFQAVWVLFIGTGSIACLGMFISKFTGENLLDRSKKTTFDYLFLHSMFSQFLVFGIAIPFFIIDYTSLPLALGILTCLAWMPLSYLINHWVGYFHCISRTILIVIAHYLFPEHRFILIPLIIVVIYVISIAILERRWQTLQGV